MDGLNQPGFIMKWTLGREKYYHMWVVQITGVIIDGLVRIEIKFSDICEVTDFCFRWGVAIASENCSCFV